MFNLFKNQKSQNLGSGKIIALMNQKGGVGKTTMAYNIARALAEKKHRVLCLDMDPQFNLSSLFGHESSPEKANIFNLLINTIRELKPLHTGTLLSEVIVSHQNSEIELDLIPSGQALSGFELTVAGINSPRQLILKNFIERNDLRSLYDYIIIDGPPTLGLLVVNILCAVDGVMYPFIPDSFSEQGLKNIQQAVHDIEEMGITKTPVNLGYIPNLFEKRRRQANEDYHHIKAHFSDGPIFEPFYNKANFAKSMANKKSVFDFQSKDYVEIQNQFLKMASFIEGIDHEQ
jgi:chromosome partitioning protein